MARSRIEIDWPTPITAAVLRTVLRLDDDGQLDASPITPSSLRALLGCEHESGEGPCFACLGTTAELEEAELAEHEKTIAARASERRRGTGRRRRQGIKGSQ